ncbi:serine/threonine protein kinase [Kribbella amoyensis]|uniref:non-specific serine/threonine protein kinase n=1 Tax=Kribbella amoyensis TaxID=996641 RepID=A0A561BLA0_9ACTN|nr:bifunctional serine/threonine protein kinase/MFS transporter [Kribbella amoyensis]TWD79664.1 serine/threonine protein kinase [Kribbella amoyensis]
MNERTVANGRYVLSEPPLGIGGMGTVWKAFDTVLHREVAVKELRIPDGLNPAERDRLRERALREARAAAGLDHPGIVTIYDVVDEAGQPWIVMRLLPGRSLDQAVAADGPLSPRRAAELGIRLLEALTAAHAKGVLHRDVKPQNVMLGGDDRWMLTDFGIASIAGATRTLTGTGMVTGTLGYVAPERLSGAEFGPAADLWAVGATLYYAVEGRGAFDHDDMPAMIAAVLTRDPAPPKHAGPLAPIIAGLMERDPARRWDTDTALRHLQNVAGGYPTFEQPTARMAGPDQPTERFAGDGSTRVMPPGATPPGANSSGTTPPGANSPGATPGDPAAEPVGEYGRNRRVLLWQGFVLNAAVGAMLALIVASHLDGLPIVRLSGGAVVALVVSGGIGVALAPFVAGRLGTWRTLGASALLMGESLLAAGLMTAPGSLLVLGVFSCLSIAAFMMWHPLAYAQHRRMGVARASTTAIWTGFVGAVVGFGLSGAVCWYQARYPQELDGNYIGTVLVGAGVAVTLVALWGIRALRKASATEPRRRWAAAATTACALLVPVLVGAVVAARSLDSRDDFTTAPDICTPNIVTKERIAKVMPDPPSVDRTLDPSNIGCRWSKTGDDAARLDVSLSQYDDSRDAHSSLSRERSSAESENESVVGLDLGDEAIRCSFDDSIDSVDTRGTSVTVRVDNLVLEVGYERAESLGAPAPDALQALAADLVEEIKR